MNGAGHLGSHLQGVQYNSKTVVDLTSTGIYDVAADGVRAMLLQRITTESIRGVLNQNSAGCAVICFRFIERPQH